MKYIDEFRDGDLARNLGASIAATVQPGRSYSFMEFCGGHTHAISRYGLSDLLPPAIRMVHGPGCPVCVLPIGRVDMAIDLALNHGVILCTYGDTLRIPASDGLSLMKAKARGGDIRMVYSTIDALQIARDNPTREVVFFAIGFETTTPPTAIAIQVAQAEASEMSLSRDNLQAGAARRGEIHRLRSTIAINEVQIEKNSQIVAAHSGRIIELLSDTGQIVSAGARVARLEVDDASTALVNVAYLAVGDGKKVTPGMRVLITPDTVERQRYGGITGVVLAVSDLAVTTEGARAVLGNADLAQALVGGTTRIEVTASLDADSTTASGYKWSSSAGPGSPVTAGLTGEMRVIVEQRAPITFVLPFLRELSGVR